MLSIFFDGQNAISLLGVGPNTPHFGILKRDHQEALCYSAPRFGETIFLAGKPTTLCFPPAETTLREGFQNTVILDRQFFNGKVSLLARMTISKTFWCPLSLEVFDAHKHSLRMRVQASGYQKRAFGVWFPAHVLIQDINRLGKISNVEDYTLINAQFNAAADVTALTQGVADGTILHDFRFGSYQEVSYRVKNHLPSDARVRRLMAQIAKDKAADQQVQQEFISQKHGRAASIWFGPPLGLALLLWSAFALAKRRASRRTT